MSTESSSASIITWSRDEDGVVVVTLDDPTQEVNTVHTGFVHELGALVEHLQAEREGLAGVVITSAKSTFVAGGDLNEIVTLGLADAARFTRHLNNLKATLRTLETLGVPVVAAINGSALGGGLELALAAHHRIVVDSPRVQLGLPEVGLGLLPASGGIVRTVRMLGAQRALDEVLLSGRRFRPTQARDLGLVDELVDDVADLLPRAKAWIAEHPDATQPWDVKGFRFPGGTQASGALASGLPFLASTLRAKTGGAPAPAQRAILAAAVEGVQVDIDAAGLIETRYFIEIATAPISKNLINLTFFDMQEIKGGASRPDGFPKSRVQKVGVVGAGMMGAGIAYAAARAGIDVVLMDTTLAGAEKGRAYSAKVEGRAVARGQRTQEAADQVVARITATDDVQDLAGVDFVIEAVFENAALKAEVFASVEQVVGAEAVLGSNTSTLPISSLAAGVARPQDFVGVHFFSPVDRMPLVEIIRGEATSDATLAKAFDLVLQLGKTPIVVNDSRGFFTSRVIIARLNEAVAMVGEGVPCPSIEQASLQAGYPAGALQLLDELTLTLPRAVREEAKAAAEAAGLDWLAHPSHAIFDRLIDEFGRVGRAGGGGFYDYDDQGKRTGFWPGLASSFPTLDTMPPLPDLVDRLLFAEVLEAWAAHVAGVIEAPSDANVGSLLGIGFPAWTGGVLRFLDQYDGGRAGFVARAEQLAARYGDRFLPPATLLETLERVERIA
ncbi:3-hydroxyacyl-CoA dehydrogenase NAD-binding domain-containing protein [Nocardioides daejeonensis]|uniref:3-hydroxyacyl-CoA dehydrogenase NAD-binding domain-containing protein n=1 Tax=Nocardioides daejeonensis TaxID=1046556 RepID=UPI001EF667CF|nr:3-hydroxyacyl-CoA dehydrogenase NAD-binding domain-containing protein [Nocardioides daejeonensis]